MGLFYYDCENITNSYLRTLHSANNQIRATNDAEDSKARVTLEEVFGCVEGDYSVQVIGAVETRAGQLITSPDVNEYPCVVFPNLIEQNMAETLTIPWFGMGSDSMAPTK